MSGKKGKRGGDDWIYRAYHCLIRGQGEQRAIKKKKIGKNLSVERKHGREEAGKC